MARKNKGDENSLELLLDTMCNTFGGVMFIAIALMVISSMIQKDIEEDIEEAPEAVDIRKIEGIKKRIGKLKKAYATQQKSRSLQTEMINRYKNHPNLELLTKLAELKDKNSALSRERIEEKTENKQLVVDLRTTTHLHNKDVKRLESRKGTKDKFDAAIVKLKDVIEKLKKKLADSKTPTRQKRKIGSKPIVATRKTPFVVILKDKKIYRVHDYQHDALYDGTSLHYCDSDIKANYDANSKRVFFKPKSGKGQTIIPGVNNARKLKRIFCNGKVDKSKRFIWIIVKKDSFKSFVILKDFLKQKGFSINWYPVVKDDELFLTFAKNVTYGATD